VSLHRYAGLILSAGFPLPELPLATGRPTVTVTMGCRRRLDEIHDWRHTWRQPGGGEWMRVARRAGGFLVQFPRLVEFEVTRRAIACSPRVGVPLRTVRHLLLDQLLPAMIAARGRTVLHASAVAIDGRAIGFTGLAGAGKSTIAAALSRLGGVTLTDDALVVDVKRGAAVATPAYPGLRLWPGSESVLGAAPATRRTRVSHYNAKERWVGVAVPFRSRRMRLDALYVLARGRTLAISPLSRQQAMMTLVEFSMMMDASDRAAVRRGFERASVLAEHLPVYRLAFPRGARALHTACAALRTHQLGPASPGRPT